MVKIPAFKPSDIKNYLAEVHEVAKERAADLARVSMGNLARAVELCKNEESSLANLDRFKSLMRFAWKRDVISLIGWSEDIATTGREAQKNFISFALRLIRENLMLTLGQKNNNLVYLAGDEASFSASFHPFITQRNVYQLTDEFNLGYSHVEANGNARIIFLDLALKVTRLIR